MRQYIKLCILLGIVATFLIIPVAHGQGNRPDPLRIYRRIVLFNKLPFPEPTAESEATPENEETPKNSNALKRIRWLEIWETHYQANGQQEWVIADYEAFETQVVASCYHSISDGGTGQSIIEMPDELIPVKNVEALWAQLQNINTDAAISHMESLNCDSGDYSMVNGYEAQHCPMPPRVDAAGIFTLGENATSSGDLWVTRSGFPIRYWYEASGQTVEITHQYEAFSVDESELPDFTPSQQVGLYCFPDGFPHPEGTTPLVEHNLTYAAFEATQTIDELKRFLDSTLQPTWTIRETSEDRVSYETSLPNNNSCVVTINFLDTGSSTLFNVGVLPGRTEGLKIPVGLEGLIQNPANPPEVVPEDPAAVLESFLTAESANGWTVRTELTFQTEDSAFSVIRNGDQQRYIMLHRDGRVVNQVIGDLPGLCGPTFVTP